ncbi:DUF4369 domain-containing protein [Kriegella aquimaris]|nr:DUF4369 domain-containing protein [Kriegella aquimaris]
MKNLFFFGLLALLVFSCGENSTDNTMKVVGNVKGLKKGMLYLQHIPDSTLVTIDSLQIEGDGNFSFTTELESPEIFYLYLDKKDNNMVNDRITFFGEPGKITINTTWNTFDTNAKITGSETNKKLEEYRKVMSEINKRDLLMMQQASNAEEPLDSLQLDSLRIKSNRNIKRGYAYALNFALNNKNSYIAPYIALFEVADANPKYLDSISNSLAPEVADSKYGRALKKHLEELRAGN